MTQKQPGVLIRFIRFLWDALNFTRRLVFNLVFLLIVGILVVASFSGGPVLRDGNALVLAPEGTLVEQFSSDPASRALGQLVGDDAPEVQVRDVVRAIDAAALDDRIDRLVLRSDRLRGGGFAALREIGAALQRFRSSGKQLIAYADGMDQRGYYLAAQADEIHLHPSGGVLLEGIGRYRAYFREGLQEKLGVNVHLFRVGEYKSFAEPFILDGPSPEAQEADLFWMDDIWDRYLAEIGAARDLDPARLQADIDNLDLRIEAVGGDLARMAVEQGLVDTLSTEDQVRQLLIERGEFDDDIDSFRQVSMDDYLAFIDRERMPIDLRPQVAIVVAQGGIVDGDQPPGAVGGVSTSRLLRDAREDDSVRAVVLRVDSPGGGVFPSEQIRREVELLIAAGKPVVASMANVAASGGYWISMDAEQIFADPSTITGSIGIFGLFMTVEDSLQRIGVRVDGVGTTRLAGAIDPARPLDPMVGRIIQSIIDNGYSEFIGKVAAARGRSIEQIDAVARGRVWSGAQAQELGLVDQLGGLHDAIADAATRAGLDAGSYGTRYVEKELSTFERFLVDMSETAMGGAVIARLGLPTMLLDTRYIDALQDELALLLPEPGSLPKSGIAYCFCELP
jgi:protease-4